MIKKFIMPFICLTALLCVFNACSASSQTTESVSAMQSTAQSEPNTESEATTIVKTPEPVQSETPEPVQNEEPEPTVELLSGYPEDFLPLYKCDKIEMCSFSVRDDPDYIIGKDIYSVSYLSSAPAEEISEYYKSFIKEEEDGNPTDIQFGILGTQRVNLGIVENDSGIASVYLTIGQKEEDYVDENPFFKTCPQNLIEVPGKNRLMDITYEEQAYGKKRIRYLKSFETELKEKDFTDFYTKKYAKEQDFTEEVDEYSHTFYWVSEGYQCQATYSLYGGDTEFISTQIIKDVE